MNEAVLQAFRQFTPRPVDAWMIEHEAFRQYIEAQIETCPAFALPTLDSPSVICGFAHAFGVCEAWMVTGQNFERDFKTVLQQQRQLCATMINALDLHRLHIVIDAGNPAAASWARHLGFEYEAGPLKGYGARGNDELFYIWKGSEDGRPR